MKINRAALHILDFVACENTISNETMDMADKTAKNYVTRHARKALGNLDNKRGEFSPNSLFAKELRAYFRGENDFLALSADIAEYLARELGHMEKPVSTDVLVVDFEDDSASTAVPTAPKGEGNEDATEEADALLNRTASEGDESPESTGYPLDETGAACPADDECPFDEDPELAHNVGSGGLTDRLDAATSSLGDRLDAGLLEPIPRYFAIFLLESKQAYVHETLFGDEGERTGIARHHAVLPNPSQKLTSYALVNLRTLAVQFVDKKRVIAGEERWLIPDGLLQCSSQASSREAFAAVTEIVEAVAEEYGENTALALSRAKAYVSDSTRKADDLDLEQMAEAVFETSPAMRERFEEAAEAVDLPESVPLEREAARRVASRHKIRTDTGIEVTFPAEYSRNPEYITFTSEPDGTISIKLSNIAHIENR